MGSKKKFLDTMILSFAIAGLLIGVLVAAQFQSAVSANTYLADEVQAQRELLDSFNSDRRMLQSKIANLRFQIEETRKQYETGEEEFLISVLDKLKGEIGLTRVTGAGVEIVLRDGEDAERDNESSVIHAADLRDLLNLLRTAGAEAISVNSERVILSTTVNAVGNSILINRTRVTPPFRIKVIGPSEQILQRLNDQSAYPDLYKRIEDGKVFFEVNQAQNLTISIFEGDYLIKYAQKS